MSSKLLRPFAIAIALVMAISMACNFSGTPTPTEAPPTATEVVQPPTEAPTEAVTEAAPTEAPIDNLAVTSLDDIKKATVQIVSEGTFIDPEVGLVVNGAGSGSGFIIDPSGIAVTNNHVVTGSALLKVWVGGESEPRNAKILGVSECSDVAVIDIEGDGYPYLQWYPGAAKVGLDVYAAGFPLGDPEFTMTRGVISKANANGQTSWASISSVLEHDARINPGNSGGPLVDATGKVIGINYASNSASQYFAIGEPTVKEILSQLEAGNDVMAIGVNGSAVQTEDGSLSGIWVSSVKSGSPADKAGVQPGDIITQMEGLVLATDGTMSDYCDVLRTHKPTDTLSLTVLRWQTGEILEGQTNGRELAVTGTFDNGAGTGGNTGGNTNDNGGFFTEEFDGNLDDWSYFLMSGADDEFSLTYSNSKLHFDINGTDLYAYYIYEKYNYTDVRIDTQADNLGRNNNNVSLICRYSDAEGWYEFNIANSGLYWIYYYSNDSGYNLIASGGSTLIRQGKDTNTYTAICSGDKLTLGINGTEVKTIRDKNLKEGMIGLSVSSFNVTPIKVDFDYVDISQP